MYNPVKTVGSKAQCVVYIWSYSCMHFQLYGKSAKRRNIRGRKSTSFSDCVITAGASSADNSSLFTSTSV